MRVLVDMDEIVVDLLGSWLEQYNETYDDNLTKADLTDWDMTKEVKPACGKKIYDIIHAPGFFAALQPLPGAVEGVLKLAEKHDVRIATSAAGPNSAKGKLEWMQTWLNWGRDRAFICCDKDWIDADWIIDDRPSTIVKCAAKGVKVASIVYPYNKHAVLTHATLRASDYTNTADCWRRFVEEIG